MGLFNRKKKEDVYCLIESVKVSDLKREILDNLTPLEFCQDKSCLRKASNKYFRFEIYENRKTGKRWIVIKGRD